MPGGCYRDSGSTPVSSRWGPCRAPPEGLSGLTLEGVTDKTWPWEMPFLMDLLAWLGVLMWANEVGTVSFLELAMSFEAHAQ